MLAAIAGRAAQSLLLLLVVSAAVFALLHLTPGDPGVLLYGPDASPQDLAQIRERWGLNEPIHLQYLRWLSNAASGDLGRSYTDGRPVLSVIGDRLPATLLLSVSSLALALVVGVSMGAAAATSHRPRLDRACTLMATIFYSTPPFWLGILLIFLLSLRLGLLPSGSMRTPGSTLDLADLLRHLALPALVLSLRDVGRFARITRASVRETMLYDYVRTAVAKGLPGWMVTIRHVLRNALLPIISLLGVAVPGLLSGAVVVETVFAWPGMGRLAVEAAMQRNYPVVLGEVLVVATVALVASLLADYAYTLVDPRITRQGRG